MENDLATKIAFSVIGAVITAIGFAINNLITQRAKIDDQLRADRIKVYQVLWQKTGMLPKWPRNLEVSYANLYQLSMELRDWYFNEGGIYMSKQAREAYEDVQATLCEVVGSDKKQNVTPIHPQEYDEIRECCSALRTELTQDLKSRKRIFLSVD